MLRSLDKLASRGSSDQGLLDRVRRMIRVREELQILKVEERETTRPFLNRQLGKNAGKTCIENGGGEICVGDTIHCASWSAKGAEVLGINPHTGELRIRSNYSGKAVSIDKENAYISKSGTCLDNFERAGYEKVCVGEKVYKRGWTWRGGVVLAINPHTKLFLVKSNKSGQLVLLKPLNLFIRGSCIGGICIETTVYPGTGVPRGRGFGH